VISFSAQLTAPAVRVYSLLLILRTLRGEVAITITDEAGGKWKGVCRIRDLLAASRESVFSRTAAIADPDNRGRTEAALVFRWFDGSIGDFWTILYGVTLLSTGEAGSIGVPLGYSPATSFFRGFSAL